MNQNLIDISESFETLVPQILAIKTLNIPEIGKILNFLSDLEPDLRNANNKDLLRAFEGLRSYIEGIVLEEISDFEPLQDGVLMLKNFLSALVQGQEITMDGSETIKRLTVFSNAPEETPPKMDTDTGEPEPFTQEDIEILNDFVLESKENLETIETALLELEQSPSDKEIINSIFRPFHTIKGVSGFLGLTEINRLAHVTENLLDLARREKFLINDEITDIVLSSVDAMKQLISGLEDRLENPGMSDNGNLDISGLLDKIEDVISTVSMESASEKLGDLLLNEGKINHQDLEECLDKQKNELPEKMIGEILIEEQKIQPMDLANALTAQKKIKRAPDLQVKVDIQKLDNLIDLAGELVISQSMLKEHTSQLLSDQKFHQNLNQLSQIVAGIQRTSMSMRMVPIKNTFQKMIRLVRDLAKNSSKQVGLKMLGEETEIDRNVVEELYEPMVHMIRNSVDHGIESPEEREAAGKPSKGTIQLTAYHKGGKIIIEIHDDGRGLDKKQLLRKAIANKLVQPNESLSDEEIYHLIFSPGFSTAKTITDISGRGVGMDVVKNSIEKLRGHLDISSQLSQGTTFTISLPLTLAIIEGMVVRICGDRYIIPAMSILETIQPKPENFHTVEGKGELIQIRDRLVPIIRLNHLFNGSSRAATAKRSLVVVIENKGMAKGLLVDELLGKGEFVIKSLGETLRGVKGLAGGTILGDGRVGLILDIAGIFDLLHNP